MLLFPWPLMGSGSVVEGLVCKPAPIKDAGMAGCSFTDCTTVPFTARKTFKKKYKLTAGPEI